MTLPPTEPEKKETPEREASQATHADKIRHLREHYEYVATQCSHWSSGIPHAIDAYEREPELLARIASLESSLLEYKAKSEKMEREQSNCQHVHMVGDAVEKLAEMSERVAELEAVAGGFAKFVSRRIKKDEDGFFKCHECGATTTIPMKYDDHLPELDCIVGRAQKFAESLKEGK